MGLLKKSDYNTKITDIENKIPRISGLATNSALTAVEDKILNVSINFTENNKKILFYLVL